MLKREQVYEMLTKEDAYAQGWGQDREDFPQKTDAYTSTEDGQPFGMMDWIVFMEKYIDEAKLAWGNYTPDTRAVRIRVLKAASLLVSALQVHGKESDLEDLAGVSSTKYPVLSGGLKTFQDIKNNK